MRSRYTAYARGDVDYVVATHDPKKRSPTLRESAAKWAESARFSGLEVVRTEAGGPEDKTGIVEFVATYVEDGTTHTLRERSRFRRSDGHWVYIDGTTPHTETAVRTTPKVGRNAPCPCGSGKKFKKCCGP